MGISQCSFQVVDDAIGMGIIAVFYPDPVTHNALVLKLQPVNPDTWTLHERTSQ